MKRTHKNQSQRFSKHLEKGAGTHTKPAEHHDFKEQQQFQEHEFESNELQSSGHARPNHRIPALLTGVSQTECRILLDNPLKWKSNVIEGMKLSGAVRLKAVALVVRIGEAWREVLVGSLECGHGSW